MASKRKAYAVAVGAVPGVYNTWAECKEQVHGVRGARFKSFGDVAAARAFIARVGPRAVATSSPRRGRRRDKHGDRHGDRDGEVEDKKGSQKQEEVDTAAAAGTSFFDVGHTRFSTLTIQFDGGSRGNPGCAGWGALVLDGADPADGTGGRVVHRACGFIGDDKTNNEAEYMGCLAGLLAARQLRPVTVHIQGDSQLVLKQLQGTSKVRTPHLRTLHAECRRVMGCIQNRATFQHLPRRLNKAADALANIAMDNRVRCTPRDGQPFASAPTTVQGRRSKGGERKKRK